MIIKGWFHKVNQWNINNFIVRYYKPNKSDYIICSFTENKAYYDSKTNSNFIQPFYVNISADDRFGFDFSKPQNEIQKVESEAYKEQKDKPGMGGLVISWKIHKSSLIKIIKKMRLL